MRTSRPSLLYPKTRADAHTDVLHGVEVADPYRWLEDLDSPETADWVQVQNEVTFGYLATLPERAAIRERLEKLWNFERWSPPVRRGRRWFETYNPGLLNQPLLHVLDSPDGEPRVLIDPNTLSADGTVALMEWTPSEDGSLLAYALSSGGSDWREVRVRDVAGGEDLPDRLTDVKFSGLRWLPDGSGFFYSGYTRAEGHHSLAEENRGQQLRFHRLGTAQTDDELVYEAPEHPDWLLGGDVSEDGRYLLIYVSVGTERVNGLFYKRLDGDGDVVRLFETFDAAYSVVATDDGRFLINTDLEAPRGRIVSVDLDAPSPAAWQEVVPESEHTLISHCVVGERLFLLYLRDAHALISRFSLEGDPEGEVELPMLGTVAGWTGRRGDHDLFLVFTGFAHPPTVYRYDVESGLTTVHRSPSVDVDPEAFTTRQVFFESADGTRVPMFVSHRRDLVPDGATPTLLYGYGGFNIPVTPAYSTSWITWMQLGGVFAVANIRGGGEYGRDWHQAAVRTRHQVAFDDFAAAARWLQANGVTDSTHLAIEGGSNGGLLVAASMIQHPELFGAVHCAVGVLDVLRFHLFTIGWAWVSDYGSPDDPDEFHAIRAYSPLHNLKPGTQYPAVLITTGDHDDRVVPSHSFKFAAALQAAQAGPAPTLIRIETRAGHGAGKPISKLIDEAADVIAFLRQELDAAAG